MTLRERLIYLAGKDIAESTYLELGESAAFLIALNLRAIARLQAAELIVEDTIGEDTVSIWWQP